MTTQAQYDAGAAAALAVMQADIAKEVPQIFQSRIPQAPLRQAAAEMADKVLILTKSGIQETTLVN